MSAAEILDELPKLTALDLQRIRERILDLEEAQEVGETPELLVAIDEGLRSAETESVYSVDEVRAKVWPHP